MNRSTSTALACAIAAVLAGGPLTAAPASAAGPASATAGGAACVPQIRLLDLPQGATAGTVRALGAGTLAAGESGGAPAYWQDRRPYRIPLPSGWTEGTVQSANAKGAMTGILKRRTAQGEEYVLFRYQQGARTVRVLTAPAPYATQGAVVNDAGLIAGLDGGVARTWQDGRPVRTLALPPGTDPRTKIVGIGGINRRGDIVGSVRLYEDSPDWPGFVHRSHPVVWPAGGGAYALRGVVENDYDSTSSAAGIDDAGTVVATETRAYHGGARHAPYVWQPPYTASATALPKLPGQEELALGGISPTGSRVVGQALGYLDGGYARPPQATYQVGAGPVRALPVPDPQQDAAAYAVSADDRVGGHIAERPAVWTCAAAQARPPAA
ncbi:hypothetical protein LG634_02845 [Streptomyces bambusae]|uniref:hypothetical protein n=1 Tax=Streptomyces bambusae TaxID=1550616 RepID=UPI001CFE1B28|nr:hypothetical protein [Streptomyces bambusae]MCB5163781.1 hypothetical protein [Streptomyces bambusae]